MLYCENPLGVLSIYGKTQEESNQNSQTVINGPIYNDPNAE